MKTPEHPSHYFNRELSWLAFNHRVLREAIRTKHPLFERLKFLAIVASNADEFFMIRVATLKELMEADYSGTDLSGMTPKQQLSAISNYQHQIVKEQYDFLTEEMIPALAAEKIRFCRYADLTPEEYHEMLKYFDGYIFPVLTPMAVDSGRPFPLILNQTLNIGVFFDDDQFATVQVPANLPRVLTLSRKGTHRLIRLEEIIKLFIDRLFPGKVVNETLCYRITRNADLNVAEEEADDLLLEIEASLRQRKWGQAIRLEIEKGRDDRMVGLLKKALEIHKKDIYVIDGALDLTFLFEIYKLKGYDHLRDPDFTPLADPSLSGISVFDAIKTSERLYYHPYERFEPVVRFVEEAADDPDVLAIKQTLYRVSGQSPIVKALERAADNGKQVTVIVELKARFDEENNIRWAKRLEKAGCHVIYGLVGLKVHSKITLVIRREPMGMQRYIHLGTGNYNDVTAKIYSDLSFFTNDPKIGEDASLFFNALSGYADQPIFHKLVQSPDGIKRRLVEEIDREIEWAKSGAEARIIAKMNALVDRDLIDKLYEASRAGVKIDLIVRGICCLKPGLEGVSDQIRVISLVGRFLEHNRTFYFHNNGSPRVYNASADWMPRNLYRRIELMFPIENPALKTRLIDILRLELEDQANASILDSEGTYRARDDGQEPVDSHRTLMSYLERKETLHA
jgi:polyphosphate kinase